MMAMFAADFAFPVGGMDVRATAKISNTPIEDCGNEPVPLDKSCDVKSGVEQSEICRNRWLNRTLYTATQIQTAAQNKVDLRPLCKSVESPLRSAKNKKAPASHHNSPLARLRADKDVTEHQNSKQPKNKKTEEKMTSLRLEGI
jgi:hypothetical protein